MPIPQYPLQMPQYIYQLPKTGSTLLLSNTKDNGLFYFTLPDFYGQYDFYIDAVLENGESAEILVDNDYCNRSIHLTYIPFSLDTIEMENCFGNGCQYATFQHL